MKVEFLVDIVQRDAPVGAAVCQRLSRLGGECAITPTFFGDADGRCTLLGSVRASPDVLVTPWYNADRTLEIWARASLCGAQLVHFPSEQFFSPAFDDEKLNVRCAEDYCRQVDAVFVWGEYYARRLVRDVGFPPERIFEVGSPRLEFAFPDQLPEGTGNPRCRRVLFVSDFTIADLRSERQRAWFTRTYGVQLSSCDVEQLGRERRYMLETACTVARQLNVEARVRPHPGEAKWPYQDACSGSNLQYSDPARPFSEDLEWADLVVGYTSTSVFEVLAAGRIFLALRSEPPPGLVWREALEQLYSKCTAETLLEYLDGSKPWPANDAVLERARHCVGNINGAYNSLEAVVSALERVNGNPRSERLAHTERWRAARGAVRALIKYFAFRLFASGLWRQLGLWQPARVRRRLSPGHALSDEIVNEYHAEAAEARYTMESTCESVEWRLGRWCWSPAPSAVGARPDDSDAVPAAERAVESRSRSG